MSAARTSATSVVVSGLVSVIAFELVVFFYGESPRAMLALLYEGTWGSTYGVGQLLYKATPLFVTALAVDLGLRAGLFNIGTEGQLAAGSLAVALMGIILPSALASILGTAILLVVAAAAGALFAVVPAILKARYGAHEVISTIMMNRIADALIGLALGAGLAIPGTVQTAPLAKGLLFSKLGTLSTALEGSSASTAIFFALALGVAYTSLMKRSRWGREITDVGWNPLACAKEGIPVGRRTVQALVASGAIAGLGSSATVLGAKGYFEQGLGAGAGFTGVAVALIARGNVVAMLFVAALFGTLQQGGLSINAHVPKEAMDVVIALVILAVALADTRVRTRAALFLSRGNA